MSEIKPEENPNPTNAEIIERVKTTLKENPNSLNLMKKGDYSVHVLIEEIKNLISIKKDHLPRPMIKITCFGQTKRTSKPENDCDAYTFNEHIYFDATDLSADTLDTSKILIEAYDYHNFSRKYYFGVHEFDFEYIYSKEKHCIKNLWIALANPEANDITKINGYLKLSISITSTEDEKVELNPDPTKDEDCMVPPQIKVRYKQLEISIYKGENFPDMENLIGKERTTNKRCNAYVEVKYLGITKCTSIVKMEGETIDWNEIIQIPVPQPTISQKVSFYVKDKKNNIIGSFLIKVDDIEKKKYEELSCINVYGTLKAADNSKAGMRMNQNPEICSRWKGRIYLKINIKDCEYPIAGVQKNRDYDFINTLRKGIARKYLWSLYIKLYSAYFLPEERETYTIKLSVQEKSSSFQKQKASQRNIDWNKTCYFTFESYTPNLEELPDLLIYLMSDDKEICFQRIKLSYFHLNDDILVIKLFPEPCIDKVQEIYYSGLVKIKAKLFNSALDPKDKCSVAAFKDGDEFGKNKLNIGLDQMLTGSIDMRGSFFESDDLEVQLKENKEEKPQEISESSKFKYYTIVACVYMTRYLVSGDSNGMSDPFCVININGETKSTSVKSKCVNGIWNEKLVFDTCSFAYGEKSTWPTMLVTVMDKDYASNDMLGYTYLWLMDTSYELNYRKSQPIKPKWEQLYLKKSNKAQGQILLSFYIYDQDHREDYKKINIEPETTLYNFEINALGLRSLKPLSFIKIKKPYISFDLNSINVSSTVGENLQPVSTLPNETGPDPNINSVIKFSAKLPTDETFMPEFQCNVYDHVLGGLSKRILGIILMDIKQIIKETTKQYKAEKDEAIKVKMKLNNEDNKENGMLEKIDIINTSENIISTSSNEPKNLISTNNDNNSLDLSNELNSPLINDNNNEINIINKKDYSALYTCLKPSDLNKIYKGKIDNSLLEKEKYNSHYFAIKPTFKLYKLPKEIKIKNEEKKITKIEIEENGINNSAQQMQDFKKAENKKDEKKEEILIEDNSNIPNKELYFPLGFNKNDNPLKIKQKQETKNLLGKITYNEDEEEKEGLIEKTEEKIINNKKHYRRIFRKELENVKELSLGAPFIKCSLKRNKYEDTSSSLNDLLEGIKDENNKIIKRFKPLEIPVKLRGKGKNFLRMDYKENEEGLKRNFDQGNYGYFKVLIRISEKNAYNEHQNFVKKIKEEYNGILPPDLTFLTAFDDYAKDVLVKRSVIVRLYILELNNLSKRDTFSESDPYIKILLGDKELVNEKKKHFKDTKNCKWYQYYDLLVELPGSSKLKIQVMDYDSLFSDDLIGETSIDIEDRYFDNRWQALENKPIEVRQLYHPDYEMSQGEVMMWLEMFDEEEGNKMEPWNIIPEPKNNLEMRLIIYETEGMENLDIEDTSDIYVLAFLDNGKKFQTDVHYRCSTGQGSFNWRMKIPVEFPRDKFDLTLQTFDNDILSRDDFICGARLNISQILNDVNTLDLPLKFSSEYYKNLPIEKKVISNIEFVGRDEDEEGVKFWVQMEKDGVKGGRVLCSLEVVPQWYADLYPVGKGREEPNVNPYLPPPVGRIKFTLNPITCLNQFTGPKFRKKCYKIVCITCCIVYLIFMIPYIIYFVSGEIFNPFRK